MVNGEEGPKSKDRLELSTVVEDNKDVEASVDKEVIILSDQESAEEEVVEILK